MQELETGRTNLWLDLHVRPSDHEPRAEIADSTDAHFDRSEGFDVRLVVAREVGIVCELHLGEREGANGDLEERVRVNTLLLRKSVDRKSVV